MNLNSHQNQVVRASNGPIAVIAGPGTGKTRTLVERIKSLVNGGVAASEILALTFTKKAAQEMTERLRVDQTGHVKAMTFHSLCLELLKEKENPPQFITDQVRLAIIKKLPRPSELKSLPARELGLQISRDKNLATTSSAASKVTQSYNEQLAVRGLSDFDDLLLRVKSWLTKDAEWRTSVQKRFSQILIDEFQDTNLVQYELLQLICGHKNILVIGDPLQSIYGFRGASGDIFTRFVSDFDAKVINLSINYRAGARLVKVANAIYPDSPQLESGNQTGVGEAQATEVLNEYGEARWVVDCIEQAIGGSDLLNAVSDAMTARASFCDFAVLYRSRSVGKAVSDALARSGIPVQIIGDGSPYDAPQVGDIVQMLLKVADPERQIVSWQNLTGAQARALAKQFDAKQKANNVAEGLIKIFGFELDDNLRQLLSVLIQFKDVNAAAVYFDTIARQNFYDPNAEAVTLLTIHAAKGLEFNHVILVGANDGCLPSKRGELEEERRLFYVAVTRARQRLDILHARCRNGEPAKTSLFLNEIDVRTLPRQVDVKLVSDERKAQKRRAKRAQTTLF